MILGLCCHKPWYTKARLLVQVALSFHRQMSACGPQHEAGSGRPAPGSGRWENSTQQIPSWSDSTKTRVESIFYGQVRWQWPQNHKSNHQIYGPSRSAIQKPLPPNIHQRHGVFHNPMQTEPFRQWHQQRLNYMSRLIPGANELHSVVTFQVVLLEEPQDKRQERNFEVSSISQG